MRFDTSDRAGLDNLWSHGHGRLFDTECHGLSVAWQKAAVAAPRESHADEAPAAHRWRAPGWLGAAAVLLAAMALGSGLLWLGSGTLPL